MPKKNYSDADLKKLKWARKMLEHVSNTDSEWQAEAELCFEFEAGHQWTEAEISAMQDQRRPWLTLNLIKPSIQLLLGVAEQNKINVKAGPVDTSDEFLTDVLTDIEDWCVNTYELENEERDALENALISGRGFCAQDCEPDANHPGEIKFKAISPPVHEVRFDPASRRDDLSDGKYIAWYKWLSEDDFVDLFPDYEDEVELILHQNSKPSDFWDEAGYSEQSPTVYPTGGTSSSEDYDDIILSDYYDRNEYRIKVCQIEYWEHYDRHYAYNPESDAVEEIKKDSIDALDEIYPARYGFPFEYETIRDRKMKWLMFIGHRILYNGDAPLQEGFSIEPIFTYKDKSKKGATHFGVVRSMIDPQKEINKRWSQALYLLLKQGSGIMAESDAFEGSIKLAEANINNPNKILLLKPNALQKVTAKPVGTYPDAPLKIEEMMQDIMKKVSGINPDLLGQDRGRQEPGVVIRLRQQQGMTLLTRLFESYKNFKKRCFERRIEMILRYMPDSQILRILGENDRYTIEGDMIYDKDKGFQANLRDLRNIKYNVRAEEAPGNISKTMATLAVIMEMMGKGFPTDPETIIEKLDIPLSEKTRWIEFIKQQQQNQMQQAQQQMQLEQQKIALETSRVQGDVQAKQATAQGKMIDSQVKAQMLGQKTQAEQAKMQLDAQKTQQGMQLDVAKFQSDNQFKQAQLGLDASRLQTDNQFRQAELGLSVSSMQQDAVKSQTESEQNQFKDMVDLRLRQQQLREQKTEGKRNFLVDMLKLVAEDEQLQKEEKRFAVDLLMRIREKQEQTDNKNMQSEARQ